MNPEWGIYVHLPWCRRRCPYCAFYVEVDRGPPWEAFTEKLILEDKLRKPAFPGSPSTVFLGGGTPSRMPIREIRRLLLGLAPAEDAELSLEANPEDIDQAWLESIVASGFHRISLGLQTFNPRFAHLLNRACSVEDAHKIARKVSESGIRSWSIDIMFGLPGQTLADLTEDLAQLLDTGAPHVSLYGLTIESGTPFERGVQRGSLQPAEDELWREMYDLLVERLEERGIFRYEVSNFARPGHESRHNRLYWTDKPYMGLGPSAHGYAPDGQRWRNVANVQHYLERTDPTEEAEHPTGRDWATDRLFSGLRYREGVSRQELLEKGQQVMAPRRLKPLVDTGLLHDDGDRIRLSHAGFPIADGIIGRVVDALELVQDAHRTPD